MNYDMLKTTLMVLALPLVAESKPVGTVHDKARMATTVKLVDINTASKAELKTIPGITDAYAAKIIAGRPYLTKAHLLTHHILPGKLYESVRKRVIAQQPVSTR